MTAITAGMVRDLRQSTGAGMMECKKALVECDGDFDKAVEFLRVKSGVKADKVASRAAAEGRIAFARSGDVAVLAEINCETDFVARGDDFAAFCKSMAETIAEAGMPGENVELPEKSEKARQELVMKVGENVSCGRALGLQATGGDIAHYIHTGDKIAAMLHYEGGDESLARDACMHIAAMRPSWLSLADVPKDEMDRERETFEAQAAESGKPPDVAKKMAEGRLKKHFAERALLLQPFVKDGSMTVEAALKAGGMTARAFARLEIGS